MSTAAVHRADQGPALFSFGFRPFFLFAAVWAALAVPVWIWSFLGSGATAHLELHVQEMLFGFLAAVVAGFLTTAIPNWTGRAPLIGVPLGALAGLWLAGRVAMLLQYFLGPVSAVIDCAFLAALAVVVWREVLAGRNWRNLPVCALVTLLALGNVAFHLDAWFGYSGAGQRVALGAIALLMALIGGRITPVFTRNWMHARGMSPLPAAPGRLDQACLAITGTAVFAWMLWPEAAWAGAALVLAGAASLVRLVRWRGWAARAEPLVWSLHLGYGWLGAGLLLLGGSLVSPEIPRSAGVHALTAGAMGVMTLAVMTRATRGHTGRPLAADAATLSIYLAINAAAVLRVTAPFAAAQQTGLLIASMSLWSLAFGGFAAVYARMLTKARAAG
jgi:uncharacterized protein involved in response to NO